jgi:hypothetical protein
MASSESGLVFQDSSDHTLQGKLGVSRAAPGRRAARRAILAGRPGPARVELPEMVCRGTATGSLCPTRMAEQARSGHAGGRPGGLGWTGCRASGPSDCAPARAGISEAR